jgi:hypothetical protein
LQCGEGFPPNINPPAVLVNQSVINGIPVDTWAWNESVPILGSAMNALCFERDTQLPYYRADLAILGGKPENITQIYGGFTPGLPADNKWTVVPDAQYCEEGASCDEFKKLGLFKYLHFLRQRKNRKL